jgi:hypothetical protein
MFNMHICYICESTFEEVLDLLAHIREIHDTRNKRHGNTPA